MAKTLSDILTDWRQHIAQPDATNSNFRDAQGTIWANDAYRQIVSVIRHLPVKVRDYSVASQSITLNSNTVTVDEAKLKNPTSGKYELLKIRSLDELLAMDPDYESATASIPSILVRTGTFSAVLYVPPNAAVIAQTTPLRTYGLELPTELSASTDTPDLPGNLHDIIPHWMAYRSFAFLENQAKATEHITLFNSRLKAHKGLTTEFSRTKKGWTYGAGIQ